mmetsp:Transcript_17367/g.50484  ORF Transcript_17367/g.50484 Transcript_17367/m.50484 type:complete len:209 (-) Transcript_17367:151-777(-)
MATPRSRACASSSTSAASARWARARTASPSRTTPPSRSASASRTSSALRTLSTRSTPSGPTSRRPTTSSGPSSSARQTVALRRSPPTSSRAATRATARNSSTTSSRRCAERACVLRWGTAATPGDPSARPPRRSTGGVGVLASGATTSLRRRVRHCRRLPKGEGQTTGEETITAQLAQLAPRAALSLTAGRRIRAAEAAVRARRECLG